MATFFENDFNKIQHYKKKMFINKNIKILNHINLKCFFKKLDKTKKKEKFFQIFFLFLKNWKAFLFPRLKYII